MDEREKIIEALFKRREELGGTSALVEDTKIPLGTIKRWLKKKGGNLPSEKHLPFLINYFLTQYLKRESVRERVERVGLVVEETVSYKIDLVNILGSILEAAEPIILQFLVDKQEKRAGLREKNHQILFRFQLYFRALASEDARELILKEFPQLLEEKEGNENEND